MNLADKPCSPIYANGTPAHNSYKYQGSNYQMGLSFRERLIIALASNPAICGYEDVTYDSNATAVIKQADCIIKEMEKK